MMGSSYDLLINLMAVVEANISKEDYSTSRKLVKHISGDKTLSGTEF